MRRARSSVVFVIAACLAGGTGCGGGEGNDEDSGEQAAGDIGLSVVVRNPDPSIPEAAGRTCQAGTGIQWNLGNPPPNLSTPGIPVSGASCLVQSDGTFHVTAEGTDPMLTPPQGQIQIDFEGTAVTGESMTARIYTTVTLQLEDILPCTIPTVRSLDAGDVWFDFTCPLLSAPDSPGAGCQANGTLVLAKCGS